jgi:PIN domain nuclease of toxin-antitoxin system
LIMRYLVDTHALLWALSEPRALSAAARDAIADPANLIIVSSASLWECAIKASIGKLEVPEDFFDSVPEAGYEVLPIRISHLNASRTLPMHHRDPFDRILVAQARAEALVLISRDPEITKYDIEILSC